MDANEENKRKSYYYAVTSAIKNNVISEFILLLAAVFIILVNVFVKEARNPVWAVFAACLLISALIIAFRLIRKQQLALLEIRKLLQNNALPYRLAYSVNIAWIVLMIAAVAGPIAYYRNGRMETERLKATIHEIVEFKKKYSETMKEEIPKKLADFDYMESVDADVTYSVSQQNTVYSGYYYTWNERAVITLYASDGFDNLTDDKQYEYLCKLYHEGNDAVQAVEQEFLHDYRDLEEKLRKQAERKEESVHKSFKSDFFIVTSRNRYQYANDVTDYFLLNGKDHFTTKSRKKHQKARPKAQPTVTPTPKKSTGYGSSRKKYVFDYDDVHNYDDPEDFWEDHEDEFEDFYDAWDYWEENQ